MIIKDIKDVKEGFVQSFKYTPLNTGSVGGNEILRLCKVGVIDQDITAIAKYLYKYKCAPYSYLVKDLKIEDEQKCYKKLMELVKKRVFNAFILTDNNDKFTTEDDALVFFTLDYGAIWLLRPIDEDENIENWKATDVLMTGLKVKKCLMLLDFYRKTKSNLEYFNPYQMFLTYGARLRTKASFKMKNLKNKEGGYFLLEIVCKNDLLDGSESDIVEKLMHYEQLLNTDGWSYAGFDSKPGLLILGDSQESLKKIKNRISDLKIDKVEYILN